MTPPQVMGLTRTRKCEKRRSKSAILSSSPYKLELEAEQAEQHSMKRKKMEKQTSQFTDVYSFKFEMEESEEQGSLEDEEHGSVKQHSAETNDQ